MSTHRLSHLVRLILSSFLIAGLVPLAWAAAAKKPDPSDYVQKLVDGETRPAGVALAQGKNGWWATGWSRTDGAGFFGKPVSPSSRTENDDTNVIVRYTRYTTDYDAELHAPLWGAYTLDRTAVANDASGERPASNPDFARPSQFFQDPLIVTFSQQIGVSPASHGTFTTTFDPRFPFVVAGGSITPAMAKDMNDSRAIQRGHMVPNNAMKSQGAHVQGQAAQIESFSVANIVPQMARSNSPSWSGLEDACFDWANELGQVWLIVGPVFHHRDQLTYIKRVRDRADQVTPSPEELFYIVIGKRDGKTAAVGFVLPHIPEVVDFKTKARSVREIEKLTGLNFMPDLGANDAVETTFDPAWLATKARPTAKTKDTER